MSVRLQGLALFAFIPLVLVLFLVQPLGTVASLLVGIFLMLGHRFLAVPFVQRHREARCLWCGRTGRPGNFHSVEVISPVTGSGSYSLCSEGEGWDCAGRWDALARLADRFRPAIRLGIGLPLVYLLGSELYRGFAGQEGWTTPTMTIQIFKGVVALTVVSISFAYLAYRRPVDGATEDSLAAGGLPAPVHNLSLLGAGWTLWIFRVVGIWWLLRILLTWLESPL